MKFKIFVAIVVLACNTNLWAQVNPCLVPKVQVDITGIQGRTYIQLLTADFADPNISGFEFGYFPANTVTPNDTILVSPPAAMQKAAFQLIPGTVTGPSGCYGVSEMPIPVPAVSPPLVAAVRTLQTIAGVVVRSPWSTTSNPFAPPVVVAPPTAPTAIRIALPPVQ